MKKTAAFACAMLLAVAARAERLTYEYTATVTSLTQFVLGNDHVDFLQQATLPGGAIAIGDTVTGRFSFDTAWSPSALGGMGTQSYADYSPADPVSAVFAQGLLFASSSPFSLAVAIDQADPLNGNDLLAFTGVRNTDDVVETLSVEFTDPAAALLTSTALADTGAILNAANGSFHYAYTTNTPFVTVRAGGALTGLHLVSAVPEPGTYAMFAAGLGLLAWRRKRG